MWQHVAAGRCCGSPDTYKLGLAEPPVKQSIGLVSLLVRDYDEALAFYVGILGFSLVEDAPVPEQNKRWVVVAPPGATESRLLLARASGPEQVARVGNQTGGRVFLFLNTDDFPRDYASFKSKGVVFVREPSQQPYGTVAVFQDPFGNLWDLLQPTASSQDGDA
jgi:catechol 2,3-dioxygenase-like lactoylglutathione lyase family enzyme